MGRAVRSLALLVVPALLTAACVVSFEDYPVASPDGSAGSGGSGGLGGAGGTAGSIATGGASGSSGGTTGGAAGSSGLGGDAGSTSAGGSSGAGAGGSAGTGVGGSTGGSGGSTVDCSLYVHGLDAGNCHAYSSVQAPDVASCKTLATQGEVILGCDLECVSSANSTCQPGLPVSGVTLADLCVLGAQTPGCTPFCSNQGLYDLAVSAQCDAAGKCAALNENCGKYRCDTLTFTCKTNCKDSYDCVVGTTCSNTQCI